MEYPSHRKEEGEAGPKQTRREFLKMIGAGAAAAAFASPAASPEEKRLQTEAILADIAPTIKELRKIEKEFTALYLLVRMDVRTGGAGVADSREELEAFFQELTTVMEMIGGARSSTSALEHAAHENGAAAAARLAKLIRDGSEQIEEQAKALRQLPLYRAYQIDAARERRA